MPRTFAGDGTRLVEEDLMLLGQLQDTHPDSFNIQEVSVTSKATCEYACMVDERSGYQGNYSIRTEIAHIIMKLHITASTA